MSKNNLVPVFLGKRGDHIERAKTVLITGGAGFVGSHLCEQHIARGDKVLCLDDLSSGRAANIARLINHPSFSFRQHDVTNEYTVDGALDLIYNLACPASPPKYQRDPIKTLKTCVLGADNALKLAVEKSAVVVQASTSEVYGDPEVSPQSEEYRGNTTTFGPRACYDEGKRAAETLFHDYRAQHGARIRVARIFNTYGPRMDPEDGRVVSNFICQALSGEAATIYGDGSQTRSFCYIDDLIVGLMSLAETSDDIWRPINLGNPGEFSILELARMVQTLTGSDAQIVHRDLPVDDPKQRRPDISLAHKVLNWHPEITLQQGLAATIPYFEEQLAARMAPQSTQV